MEDHGWPLRYSTGELIQVGDVVRYHMAANEDQDQYVNELYPPWSEYMALVEDPPRAGLSLRPCKCLVVYSDEGWDWLVFIRRGRPSDPRE